MSVWPQCLATYKSKPPSRFVYAGEVWQGEAVKLLGILVAVLPIQQLIMDLQDNS